MTSCDQVVGVTRCDQVVGEVPLCEAELVRRVAVLQLRRDDLVHKVLWEEGQNISFWPCYYRVNMVV